VYKPVSGAGQRVYLRLKCSVREAERMFRLSVFNVLAHKLSKEHGVSANNARLIFERIKEGLE
jgi:hypothetical protein